jgi:hypothetical protein
MSAKENAVLLETLGISRQPNPAEDIIARCHLKVVQGKTVRGAAVPAVDC